jgi:hypothetical protein
LVRTRPGFEHRKASSHPEHQKTTNEEQKRVKDEDGIGSGINTCYRTFFLGKAHGWKRDQRCSREEFSQFHFNFP